MGDTGRTRGGSAPEGREDSELGETNNPKWARMWLSGPGVGYSDVGGTNGMGGTDRARPESEVFESQGDGIE